MIGVEAGSLKESISEADAKKVEADDMRGGGLEQLVGKFHKLVDEGPTYVCICCDQLWYKHSVRGGETLRIVGNEAVLKCLPVGGHRSGKDWVCRTCHYHLKKNKIPPCAVKNNMNFPLKPECLDLTELEWKLVSPRLVFQKRHKAARGKQWKIHGNLVNVPADVVNTVHMLPRQLTDTETIKVQLKRKLKYRNYVF